jgi:uncharacterized membrane-anchored protein
MNSPSDPRNQLPTPPWETKTREPLAPSVPKTPPTPPRSPRLLLWRLVVPLCIQTGLILAVPAGAVYTHLTGKTVRLQTAPVDPYSLFHGYSVTLSYDISSPERLKTLPGWSTLGPSVSSEAGRSLPSGSHFYLVLVAPDSQADSPRSVWTPLRISGDRPTGLPSNQVALKGRVQNGSSVIYNLETYYIPEAQREAINQDLSPRPGEQGQPAIVEAKVDALGHAVPLSIWITDPTGKGQQSLRQYRF